MKHTAYHSLWMHVPVLVLLAGYIGYWLTQIGRLPARVPIQFGVHGQPIAYGSPWLIFGMTVFLAALFIPLTAVMEELWVRQERRKRFNPLALLDDLTVGVLVGFQVGFVFMDGRMGIARWIYGVGIAGAAVAAAAIVERLRPFVDGARGTVAESTTELRHEMAEQLSRGQHVLYWDVQNPRYVSFLSLLVPVILWVGAGVQVGTNAWVASLLFIVGALSLLLYGGQRTLVTRNRIVVRYGIVGIPVLRLDTAAIREVGVVRFSPLQDFGGYGIRRNRGTVAYYLCGDHGVILTTKTGKRILIGSTTPDRLAAVIASVAGLRTM